MGSTLKCVPICVVGKRANELAINYLLPSIKMSVRGPDVYRYTIYLRYCTLISSYTTHPSITEYTHSFYESFSTFFKFRTKEIYYSFYSFQK